MCMSVSLSVSLSFPPCISVRDHPPLSHRVILGVHWCVETGSEALYHGVTSPAGPKRSQESIPTSADMASGSKEPFKLINSDMRRPWSPLLALEYL